MFDDRLPFTRRQLRRAGLDESLLKRNAYQQIVTGVWVRGGVVDPLSLIRAAVALHPEHAFVSHLSAAQVLGLPVPEHTFAHITVARPDERRYRKEIKTHVTTRPRRIVVKSGLRVTDPIATFIDCAGWLSLVDRVILGDALCKKFAIDASRLRSACRESTDYYAGLAAEAAALVRNGVDSPMETRLRLLIVFAGLPEPTVNHIVRAANGDWKRRYDLVYLAIRLIIEYDGKQHADIEQWQSDLERREEFDDDGFRVIVVTAKGIFANPADTLQRIRRQLVLRGWGDVPEIDDRWLEHFAA